MKKQSFSHYACGAVAFALLMPKYAREAASGRFSVYQSMQEKLPVAGSMYKLQ